MKKTYTLSIVAASIGYTAISSVFAQGSISTGITNIGTLIDDVRIDIISSLITLFGALALAAFFFGMVQFIWASREGDSKKLENGKQFMIWSVVALFVMFSIWGIVTFFQTTFGVTQNNINIPKINVNGGGTTNTTNAPGLPTGTQTLTCPDGITHYSSPADYDMACAGHTSAPVGFCSDGTPYYDQEAASFCN